MMQQDRDYWSRAWNEFDLWKEIFASIDSLVDEFAEAHQMKCQRWDHDTPSRILSWTESGLGRNIELFLEGMPGSFKLRIAGSAWKDIPQLGQRKWTYQIFSHLQVPVDQMELRKVSDTVYQIESGWAEADLKRTARVAK